jgi:hypothetical protein
MIFVLSDLGYSIHDCESPTPLYNHNDACVKWYHNMTTKGNRHIENKENSTREWVVDGTISVSHISGKYNICATAPISAASETLSCVAPATTSKAFLLRSQIPLNPPTLPPPFWQTLHQQSPLLLRVCSKSSPRLSKFAIILCSVCISYADWFSS